MKNRFIFFLIIFLLIFSAQLIILQILLLRPQLVQAALPRIETKNPEETKAKCPCSSQSSSANEGAQLYIPIPWVTDGCGYVCDVNYDGKANVVDYIVSIYKFLVGLAAILAVIMIVWGGLLRIFSGGQANKISASNDTIVSAIIGLVLALISVSLLQAINPALTNIELPSLTNIGRVSVAGIFATDDDIMLREDSELVALDNQILNDQEAQNLLTQNSKLKTQNHSLKLKTDLISIAKAQSVSRIDNLLGQELAYEADDQKKLKDSYGCPDGRMCFLIDKSKLDKELVLGSKLKCNSTVDVKVAHINFKEDTDPITFKKIKTNIIESIECYHGLCDPEKNMHWDGNIKAISIFIGQNYNGITYDAECLKQTISQSLSCIFSSEGKDVGSAFAYGQDCSEIGSTGLCLVEFGKGADAVRCIDVKSLCESSDKTACDDVNNQIHNEDLYGDKFKDMGCARRYDKWTKGFGFASGDNCVFGPTLYCPPSWNRVSYTKGDKGECWVENKDKEREPRNFGKTTPWWSLIPLLGYPLKTITGTGVIDMYVLDNYLPSILGTSAVCCQNPVPVNGQYQYKAIKEFWTISVANELEKYNLDLENSKCKGNAGENKKDGFKLMWQEKGIMKDYKDGGSNKTIAAAYTNSNPTKGENSKSYCDNQNVLKTCYVPYRPLNIAESAVKFYEIGNNYLPEFNRGIFSTSQNCIDGAKEYFFGVKRCYAHLVPKEFCCIGETNCGAAAGGGGNGGGGGSGVNPLKILDATYDTDAAFKQGADVINTFYQVPVENFTQDAEALLRALAITESEGKTKPDDSGKGYYGLMQISPTEVQQYSKNPIQVSIPTTITPDWIETNPVASIQIATNYIVDMLNNPIKICPKQSTRYKDPEDPGKNRQCDYINEGEQDKYYSACQDAFNKTDLKEKLKYIYAAYNGGAEANCHNVTNFNPSPPCSSSICPFYQVQKGSIWECDAKTGPDSYEQTRGGALRMVDCFDQFKKDLNPSELTGCCSNGQASCLTNCPAG